MRDTFIAYGPTEEDLGQMSDEGYIIRSRIQCEAYVEQIRREWGVEPEGASLIVIQKFRNYPELFQVNCAVDYLKPAAIKYLDMLESKHRRGYCEKWDAQARRYLARHLPSPFREKFFEEGKMYSGFCYWLENKYQDLRDRFVEKRHAIN